MSSWYILVALHSVSGLLLLSFCLEHITCHSGVQVNLPRPRADSVCGSKTELGEYVIVIILVNQSLALRSAELQSSEKATLKAQQNIVRYFPLVLWCSLQLILTSSKIIKRWSLQLAG